VRRLLGGAVRGVVQSNAANGAYPTKPRPLSDDDICAHLVGEKTIAYACAAGGASRFCGFDLDACFPARLPVLHDVLRDYGVAEEAMIATSGSSPDRGKLVVFFAHDQAQLDLWAFATNMLTTAQRDHRWGSEQAEAKSDLRPAKGGGGLLRIGGRNRRADRHAKHCDVFFAADGELKDLADVIPSDLHVAPVSAGSTPIAPASRAQNRKLHKGIIRTVNEPWVYGSLSSATVFQRCVHLAREALRVYGEATGSEILAVWMSHIWDNSPGMHEPTPTTGDRRIARTWERHRENAWQFAIEAASRKKPNIKLPKRQKAAYDALWGWADEHGLRREVYSLTYRQIAAMMGLADPKDAHCAVRGLLKRGLVVIHDSGTPGVGGLPSIFGLVLPSDPPQWVQTVAATSELLRKRRAVRLQLTLAA